MTSEPLQSSISPRELHRRCSEGQRPEIIDVRTAPEFAGSHVAGTRSAPLHELDPSSLLPQRIDPQAPLYILCQSGARGAKAIEKFRAVGFQRCVLIEGGVDAWSAAGFPLEHGETRMLPLQRQVHLIVGISGVAGALLGIAVDKWFALIPLVTGCGLAINGFTGWCGLGLLLARMPWNQASACSSDTCCKN